MVRIFQMTGNEKVKQSSFRDCRPATLSLILKPNYFRRLLPLMQQGFLMKVPAGGSIKAVLCQHLGLSPDYLEGRIQTIFLDGKPVDDVDKAFVGDGATLALSAAMPGLVGATFRKGGFYAAMRAGITYSEGQKTVPGAECLVALKLFNLLASELGPLFLEKGIWVKKAVLIEFLKNQPADFWTGCQEARLDGEILDAVAVPNLKWAGDEGLVCLRVFLRLES